MGVEPDAELYDFNEPSPTGKAGFGKWQNPKSPYDRFMEAQGVPIHRDIGVHKVQDLPMAPWKRLGGRGTAIQLLGTEHLWGMYVVEVPGAGALNAERHLYEETYYVVEGRGTTEVWHESESRKQTFEWGPGSLFGIPLNAWHRVVNATSSPAMLLAATTAPNILNLVRDAEFVMNCPYEFSRRFTGEDDYFKPVEDIHADPVRGLAMRLTNVIPDIVTCELPRDNRRSFSYRRGGAAHGRGQLLHEDRRVRDRPVLQGPQAQLRGHPGLHQGQGVQLYLAGYLGHEAVAGGPRRRRQATDL